MRGALKHGMQLSTKPDCPPHPVLKTKAMQMAAEAMRLEESLRPSADDSERQLLQQIQQAAQRLSYVAQDAAMQVAAPAVAEQ